MTPPAPRRTGAAPGELLLDLSRPGHHALPGFRGTLEVARAADGVPAALLRSCRVVARQGGERWQARPRSVPRSLKKQYQAACVPAWEREGPLFYSGGQLVYVPGLGIDARVIALPGQPQVSLRWLPSLKEG